MAYINKIVKPRHNAGRGRKILRAKNHIIGSEVRVIMRFCPGTVIYNVTLKSNEV